ncbi:MAG: hypothetical protein Q9193_002323 [Seirophora villosa]
MTSTLEPKEAWDNDVIYQDFYDMQDYFKDKETEANWLKRDESIILLTRYAIGNILYEPDIEDLFVDGIKPLVPGIIKAINSLRTTLSTHGCDLVEVLARTKSFPHIMESVFPHLVKLCASTKKIAATKAEKTANTVISHSSYNTYFLREIWSACQDKNVQPRKSAALWLQTFVSKHRQSKTSFEKGEGVSLFEQCLKKGLSDGNADVRKSMRPAYWAFIRLWPKRSEDILSTLSDQHRKVLLTESADVASTLGPAKTTVLAAAATTVSKPKPSIKDTIAAKRQAVKSVQPEPAKSIPEPEAAKSIPEPEPTRSISRPEPTTVPQRQTSVVDRLAARRQAAKTVEPEPSIVPAAAGTRYSSQRLTNVMDRLAARRQAIKSAEPGPATSIPKSEPTTVPAAGGTTTAPQRQTSVIDRLAARRQAAKMVEPEPSIVLRQPYPRTLSSAPVRPSRLARNPSVSTSAIEVPKARIPTRPASPFDFERPLSPLELSIDAPKARTPARAASPFELPPLSPFDLSIDALKARMAARAASLSPVSVRPPRLARNPTSAASTIEVPRARMSARPASPFDFERPLSPLELNFFGNSRPGSPIQRPSSMSKTIIDMAKGAWSPKSQPGSPIQRPSSSGSMSQTIIDMAKGAWSPKSQPLSPGTIAKMAKAGWSKSAAETSPPPTTPPLPPTTPPLPPSPAGSSATVVRRSSRECEALRQSMVDGPIKPVKGRKAPAITNMARKALGQLPVNEPKRVFRDLTKVKIDDMSPKEKWTNVERIHRRASPRIKFQATNALREQLRAHIRALKSDQAGIQTFHDIQRIIKTNWLVLDDEKSMFDDLLFEILSQMEEPEYQEYGTTPTGHDRNTQLVLVLRVLLENHCSLIMDYFPRVLCALISASRNQHFESHMQPCLQETVKQLIRECTVVDLEASIDAVLEVFETHPHPSIHPQEMGMGLYMLRLLMRSSLKHQYEHIDEQEKRIAAFGYKCCKTEFPEMRQLAIRMLMQYRIFINDDARFWRRVGAAGENCARLLAYYYEKERVEQQLEVERLLLARAMDEDVD